jgi:hypothetical protein
VNADEDSLQIGRLRLEYTFARGHPDAPGERARLNRILESATTGTLRRLLSAWFDGQPGLCFIRRFEFDVSLDAGLPPDRIAARWTAQLAKTLLKRVSSRAATDDIIWFADAVTYRSRFLADLAKGIAWNAWYYRPFCGLKPLPASAALRTAILDEPSEGLHALLQLDRADRARVVNALTPGDSHRVVQGLGQGGDNSASIGDIVDALNNHSPIPVLVSDEPWPGVLNLYLIVLETAPSSAGSTLLDLCTATIFVQQCLTALPTRIIEELRMAIRGGNTAELCRIVEKQQASRMLPILSQPSEQRNALLTAIVENTHHPSTAGHCTDEEVRYTPFGGLFLLLPQLQEMPIEAALRTWPELETAGKAAAFRLLLLALTQGKERMLMALRDPVSRDLCGVPRALTAADLVAWLNTVKPKQQQTFLRIMADWRLSRGVADEVRHAHMAYGRRQLGIAFEPDRGCWLFLGGCQPNRMEAWLNHLRKIVPGAVSIRQAQTFDRALHASDLDYLALPDAFKLQFPMRMLLATVAQGVMKQFAYRLPGFARSSSPYLRQNFLAMSAALRPEPARWVVELSRVPLNVVLNMTGMTRARFHLQPFDERPIELFQAD